MNRRIITIFWLEEDPVSISDHVYVLGEKYKIEIGASWEEIQTSRQNTIDLVVIDLMIHHLREKDGDEVENISFPNISWKATGLEFLKRLRQGEYVDYGFNKDVPVIVATAVITYPAKELAEEKGISDFLVKPFSIQELKDAIDRNVKIQL